MKDKTHLLKVTETHQLSSRARESLIPSAPAWYEAVLGAELSTYEAVTRPAEALRKQLKTLEAMPLPQTTAGTIWATAPQVSTAWSAASSLEEQFRCQTEVASAAAKCNVLNSVSGTSAALRAYESLTSARAGLEIFESAENAFRTLESVNSTSAAMAKKRVFDSIAGVAARTDILNSALLARNRAVEEILTPSKAASRYLEEMSGTAALQLAAEQYAKWSAPHKEFTASIARFNERLGISSARALLESMTQASEPYGLSGLMEEATQLPESEELHENALQLVRSITDTAAKAFTAQEAVAQIIQAIHATKEPQYQKLLLAILWPVVMAIVFSLVNPVADFYVKKWLEGTPKQEATKQVKEAAREAVGDVRMLKNYKFVSIQHLDLRTSPRANALVVGQLRFGQTVHVLEKERDFTLVTWRSEDGKVELQGWVFSRYLKRFG